MSKRKHASLCDDDDDNLASQPDWMKMFVVDFLTAGEALKLSATCRALRVVQLVSKRSIKSTNSYSTGYVHRCVRWQWLRSDNSPAKVHSTLIKAQAWEEGADSRDGRLEIVATDNTKRCKDIGCWTYNKLPDGNILPNKHGINVFKTKPAHAHLHCEFRPQLTSQEYSVWVCYGGGMNETNVVEIRQFQAKDLIYRLQPAGEEDEEKFFKWQTKRAQEWNNFETKWHRENPPLDYGAGANHSEQSEQECIVS